MYGAIQTIAGLQFLCVMIKSDCTSITHIKNQTKKKIIITGTQAD